MKTWSRLTAHERAREAARVRAESAARVQPVSGGPPFDVSDGDALNSSREIISAALALLDAGDVEGARVILRGKP